MFVTIPKEYQEHFQDSVAFITWWKKPTLLLMNREEKERFQKILDGAWTCYKGGGCKHGIRMLVIELVIKNGVIDIPVPEDPSRRLQGENRAFMKVKAGIALS